MIIEMIQTAKASLPVVPAMPPMEKSTSGGTPAATQKAPFQSSARISFPSVPAAMPAFTTSVIAEFPFYLFRTCSSIRLPERASHGSRPDVLVPHLCIEFRSGRLCIVKKVSS